MTYPNQSFYDNEPHPLLWAGPRAARGKIVISGIPNRPNCCVICTAYTQLEALRYKPEGRGFNS